MARGRPSEKRKINFDPFYNDQVCSKFINYLMWDGKKTVAEHIFYEALSFLSKHPPASMNIQESSEERGASSSNHGGELSQMPVELKIFHIALENAQPHVEVRSRRVGGATYAVPCQVEPNRARALAMRWIVEAARKRSENEMWDRLARELLEAAQGRGGAIKTKEMRHRSAEANKAFAHYRW